MFGCRLTVARPTRSGQVTARTRLHLRQPSGSGEALVDAEDVVLAVIEPSNALPRLGSSAPRKPTPSSRSQLSKMLALVWPWSSRPSTRTGVAYGVSIPSAKSADQVVPQELHSRL